LLLIVSVALISYFDSTYFSKKISFSDEHRIEALESINPNKQNFDSTKIVSLVEQSLIQNNIQDSLFKGLIDTMSVRTNSTAKLSVVTKFISAANTEQSKTQKVSIVIFWIACIILAIYTFFKNFSLIPLLGLVSCLYLLTGMTKINWAWFSGWLLIGLIVYFSYGKHKSKLALGQ
jgi:hypothetical protein